MSWHEALPKIVNDKRYSALKSLSERKRVFESFRQLIKLEEEEQSKIQEQNMQKAYVEMLKESKSVHFQMRFEEAEQLFRGDSRSIDFHDLNLKRRIFYDYLDDLEKVSRIRKKEERTQFLDEFAAWVENLCRSNEEKTLKITRDKLKEEADFIRFASILSDADMNRIFDQVARKIRQEEEVGKSRNVIKKSATKRKYETNFVL